MSLCAKPVSKGTRDGVQQYDLPRIHQGRPEECHSVGECLLECSSEEPEVWLSKTALPRSPQCFQGRGSVAEHLSGMDETLGSTPS